MPEALDRNDSPGLVRPENCTPANGRRPGPGRQMTGGWFARTPTTAGPDAASSVTSDHDSSGVSPETRSDEPAAPPSATALQPLPSDATSERVPLPERSVTASVDLPWGPARSAGPTAVRRQAPEASRDQRWIAPSATV